MLGHMLQASPLWAGLGLSLLHFLWQGCLVALVLAALLGLAGERRAALRYALSCGALVMMAAFPLLTLAWVVPDSEQAAPAEAWVALSATPASPAVVPGTVEESLQATPAEVARGRIQAAAAGNRAELLRQQGRIALYRLAPWLSLGWFAGVGVMALRLFGGAWGVEILKRRRVEPVHPRWQEELTQLKRRMGIRRAVTLMGSSLVQVPMVVGWLRPVVLLPVSALTGIAPDQLRLLLAHELSHLQRRDHWFNLLQLLVETLLFYHPAVWWVSRKVREEREHCCDDVAVRFCASAVEYAQALAAMAQLRAQPVSLALSAGGGRLLARIQRLLEPQCDGLRSPQRGLVALAALVLTFGVAVAGHAALADGADGRLVQFPDDVSLGELYIRDAGGAYNPSIRAAGQGEGWRSYTEAYGPVEVPAGTELMLRVHPASVAGLPALANLGPDDLQRLDLTSCNVGDADLAHIKGLTGLRGLSLFGNGGVTDAGLAHLADMDSLVWLSLEQTAATCDAPALERLAALEYLDVYKTPLSDAGLSRICRLPALKSLGIESAMVSAAALASLGQLRTLEEANLELTNVDDSTLAALKDLPKLRYLSIARTHVTDEGVASLAALESLEVLDVRLTGVGDAGIEPLAKLPRLQQILAANSAVTPEALAALQQDVTGRAGDAPAPQASQQRSTNPEAPRVGIVMSHFTATGPHAIERPYGYEHQSSLVFAGVFAEYNYDVYAIVEPGTENEGDLPTVLSAANLVGKTINGADAAALKTLDCIFVKALVNCPDDVMKALVEAVRSGVGMVSMSTFGGITPGLEAEPVRLVIGTPEPEYIYGIDGECKLLNPHPILGSMKPGDTFAATMFSGYCAPQGLVNATPLFSPPEGAPEDFCPMYVHNLGFGRVVRLQWFDPLMPETPFNGPWELYTRAVNWAAKRPVDARW